MSQPEATISYNAHFIQVYANNGLPFTVTTACEVNTEYTPPYVTNLTPIDHSAFAGPQTDAYVEVIATGQIIRAYQTPASGGQTLKLG